MPDLTTKQIQLLINLRDSKARGAASLGCSSHHITAASLAKLGLCKQHGFGPHSYVITDDGLKSVGRQVATPVATTTNKMMPIRKDEIRDRVLSQPKEDIYVRDQQHREERVSQRRVRGPDGKWITV